MVNNKSIFEQQTAKGEELLFLYLCLSLLSEKDGIDQGSHFSQDTTKVKDEFISEIETAILNMVSLNKLVPLMLRLSAIGRKLEAAGKIKVLVGDTYSNAVLAYCLKLIDKPE